MSQFHTALHHLDLNVVYLAECGIPERREAARRAAISALNLDDVTRMVHLVLPGPVLDPLTGEVTVVTDLDYMVRSLKKWLTSLNQDIGARGPDGLAHFSPRIRSIKTRVDLLTFATTGAEEFLLPGKWAQ